MTQRSPKGSLGNTPVDTNTPLILDMLAWLAAQPRLYAEVMDVWRTSCPRLTIWEDAVDQGLVVRRLDPRLKSPVVDLTLQGRRALHGAGRSAAA